MMLTLSREVMEELAVTIQDNMRLAQVIHNGNTILNESTSDMKEVSGFPNGYIDVESLRLFDDTISKNIQKNNGHALKAKEVLNIVKKTAEEKKIFNQSILAISKNGISLGFGNNNHGLYHIIDRHFWGGKASEFSKTMNTMKVVNLCMREVEKLTGDCKKYARWDGSLEVDIKLSPVMYNIKQLRIVIADPKFNNYGELTGGRIITCIPVATIGYNKDKK